MKFYWLGLFLATNEYQVATSEFQTTDCVDSLRVVRKEIIQKYTFLKSTFHLLLSKQNEEVEEEHKGGKSCILLRKNWLAIYE